MIGRTPASISAVRPLRHGVITDFEVTEAMLRHFIGRVHKSRFAHPRLVMCAPSGITDVERRALVEACLGAGARSVQLIEEPMAAAIGAELPIEEPMANVVVDVGGGTSEVAVISLGGIVVSRSLRVGGYDFDDSVAGWIRRHHRLAIGETTAESVKREIGGVRPGRDRVDHRGARPRPGERPAARGGHHRARSCATRSSRWRSRSSTRSRTRSRTRRPSWPRTSPATASCSPAAAGSCAASASGSRPRPACRCGSPTTRSPASCSARAARSRRSRSSSAPLSSASPITETRYSPRKRSVPSSASFSRSRKPGTPRRARPRARPGPRARSAAGRSCRA